VIYYIYSPKKYKVYWISTTRVKDSKGLDNSHNILYLEDRVLTPNIEILDRLSLEVKDILTNEEESDSSNNNISYSPLDKVIYPSDLELESLTNIIRIIDKWE
jgi:hypothetical protein